MAHDSFSQLHTGSSQLQERATIPSASFAESESSFSRTVPISLDYEGEDSSSSSTTSDVSYMDGDYLADSIFGSPSPTPKSKAGVNLLSGIHPDWIGLLKHWVQAAVQDQSTLNFSPSLAQRVSSFDRDSTDVEDVFDHAAYILSEDPSIFFGSIINNVVETKGTNKILETLSAKISNPAAPPFPNDQRSSGYSFRHSISACLVNSHFYSGDLTYLVQNPWNPLDPAQISKEIYILTHDQGWRVPIPDIFPEFVSEEAEVEEYAEEEYAEEEYAEEEYAEEDIDPEIRPHPAEPERDEPEADRCIERPPRGLSVYRGLVPFSLILLVIFLVVYPSASLPFTEKEMPRISHYHWAKHMKAAQKQQSFFIPFFGFI